MYLVQLSVTMKGICRINDRLTKSAKVKFRLHVALFQQDPIPPSELPPVKIDQYDARRPIINPPTAPSERTADDARIN